MRCATLGVTFLIVLLAAAMLPADTITSSDFTLAFGASPANKYQPTWDKDESPTLNSPTTQGDFSMNAVISGGGTPRAGAILLNWYGVTFPEGVLSDGAGTIDAAAWIGPASAQPVAITASYNGAAPVGTNYQLMIQIDSISVWGVSTSSSTVTTLNFDETTAGHTQSSPSINLQQVANTYSTLAADYTQLVWNPADYSVALGGANDPFTRTIAMGPTVDAYNGVDGLIVQGRVILSYDVPEPSTLALLTTGLIGLLCYAWRKRR